MFLVLKPLTALSFLWVLTMTSVLPSLQALAAPKTVLVSGAGGQTGQSLFRKLLALPEEFQPFGLVRSIESKQRLLESGGIDDDTCVLVCDVTDPQSVQAAIDTALTQTGAPTLHAFFIATSAKPSPTEEMDSESGRPIFHFPNGDPELVDWMGQKHQIDATAAFEGCHVVLCSTMGGTNPNHPLNNLGRTVVNAETGETKGGMIVQWKRKAEMYLMEQEPKILYTIVHPGGLVNEPGGQRTLVVGVDDQMTGTESRTVPREDVAEVMLQAVRYPQHYGGRSFDLRAKALDEDESSSSSCGVDYATLLDSLQGANCDYTLGATM